MDKWRELFGMLLSLPAGAGLQLSVLQSSVRFMQNLRVVFWNNHQHHIGSPINQPYSAPMQMSVADMPQLLQHFNDLVTNLRHRPTP